MEFKETLESPEQSSLIHAVPFGLSSLIPGQNKKDNNITSRKLYSSFPKGWIKSKLLDANLQNNILHRSHQR